MNKALPSEEEIKQALEIVRIHHEMGLLTPADYEVIRRLIEPKAGKLPSDGPTAVDDGTEDGQ